MTTFINTIKHSATFTNLMKRLKSYLLKEDGYKLLLENGGGILLDVGVDFTNTTKNNSTFTNQIKN